MIFIAVLRRMLRHIESLEQLLKVVLFVDVIVGLEHVQKQTLAEAARTDKEKEVACPFHPLEVHTLVHQIFVFLPYLLKVRDTVGNALEIVAHRLLAYR